MKISILTAVYNREATIGQALESLAGQSWQEWEHIVQDGASRDATLSILGNHSDPRRHIESVQDGGIYDALNRAFARSSGDVIGILHSDDFFAHSDVLAHVARRFEETGADAIYGDLDYVAADDTSKVIRHWKSGAYHPGLLRRGWMPPHPALFLRRDVITHQGGYDTSFRIAADYDSILRYFGKGCISAAYLPEVLVKMRVGGESNRSLERILRKSREDYRAIRKNNVGGMGVLLLKNVGKLSQFVMKS